jgi:hypothetical protein
VRSGRSARQSGRRPVASEAEGRKAAGSVGVSPLRGSQYLDSAGDGQMKSRTYEMTLADLTKSTEALTEEDLRGRPEKSVELALTPIGEGNGPGCGLHSLGSHRHACYAQEMLDPVWPAACAAPRLASNPGAEGARERLPHRDPPRIPPIPPLDVGATS